jgi:hypothetical protein
LSRPCQTLRAGLAWERQRWERKSVQAARTWEKFISPIHNPNLETSSSVPGHTFVLVIICESLTWQMKVFLGLPFYSLLNVMSKHGVKPIHGLEHFLCLDTSGSTWAEQCTGGTNRGECPWLMAVPWGGFSWHPLQQLEGLSDPWMFLSWDTMAEVEATSQPPWDFTQSLLEIGFCFQ